MMLGGEGRGGRDHLYPCFPQSVQYEMVNVKKATTVDSLNVSLDVNKVLYATVRTDDGHDHTMTPSAAATSQLPPPPDPFPVRQLPPPPDPFPVRQLAPPPDPVSYIIAPPDPLIL